MPPTKIGKAEELVDVMKKIIGLDALSIRWATKGEEPIRQCNTQSYSDPLAHFFLTCEQCIGGTFEDIPCWNNNIIIRIFL